MLPEAEEETEETQQIEGSAATEAEGDSEPGEDDEELPDLEEEPLPEVGPYLVSGACTLLDVRTFRVLGEAWGSSPQDGAGERLEELAATADVHVVAEPGAAVFRRVRVDGTGHPLRLDAPRSSAEVPAPRTSGSLHPAQLGATSLSAFLGHLGLQVPVPDEQPTDRPFLSVITRTQGTRGRCLEDVLTCLAAQTDRDFELLLMRHRAAPEAVEETRRVLAEFPAWLTRADPPRRGRAPRPVGPAERRLRDGPGPLPGDARRRRHRARALGGDLPPGRGGGRGPPAALGRAAAARPGRPGHLRVRAEGRGPHQAGVAAALRDGRPPARQLQPVHDHRLPPRGLPRPLAALRREPQHHRGLGSHRPLRGRGGRPLGAGDHLGLPVVGRRVVARRARQGRVGRRHEPGAGQVRRRRDADAAARLRALPDHHQEGAVRRHHHERPGPRVRHPAAPHQPAPGQGARRAGQDARAHATPGREAGEAHRPPGAAAGAAAGGGPAAARAPRSASRRVDPRPRPPRAPGAG